MEEKLSNFNYFRENLIILIKNIVINNDYHYYITVIAYYMYIIKFTLNHKM